MCILAGRETIGGNDNGDGQSERCKISSNYDCTDIRGSIANYPIYDNYTCTEKPNVPIFHYFFGKCYHRKRGYIGHG